jgi:RNA polymerase sigma-70 factor, ECF subfamily
MSPDEMRAASITDLIPRVRSGDPKAKQELFRRSQPMIEGLASRRRARAQRAGTRLSDITQETITRAFQKLKEFRGQNEGELLAWFASILDNYVKQSHRDSHRQKRDASATVVLDETAPIPSLEQSQSQAISRMEEQSRLVAQIAELKTPEQREAIYLFYLQGRSVAEVAAIMKKTQASIGGYLQRGLHALRQRRDEPPSPGERSAAGKLDVLSEAESAFLAYVRRHHAREDVDRRAFLDQHPECADEIRTLFDWLDRARATWAADSDSHDEPAPGDPLHV